MSGGGTVPTGCLGSAIGGLGCTGATLVGGMPRLGSMAPPSPGSSLACLGSTPLVIGWFLGLNVGPGPPTACCGA